MTTATAAAVDQWKLTPDGYLREWQKFWAKMLAWPKAAQIARQVRVGVTPTQTVYREDKLRLLRYESEVDKAGDPVFRQNDVGRLYVPMDEAAGMNRREPLSNMPDQTKRLFKLQFRILKVLRECLTRDVLHDQELLFPIMLNAETLGNERTVDTR